MGSDTRRDDEIDGYLSSLTSVKNEIDEESHVIDEIMEKQIAKIILDFWMYKIEDKKIIAEFYFTIGKAYTKIKKIDEALSSLKLTHELYHELKMYEDEINTLNEIGRIFNKQGDYMEAEKYYNSVYDLVNTHKLGNNQRFSALANLGKINTYKENHLVAIDLLEDAIESIDSSILEEKRLGKYLSGIYFNLVINYLHLNDFNKGLDYYNLCEKYSKNTDHHKSNIEELVYKLIEELDDTKDILASVVTLLLKLTDKSEEEIVKIITSSK